MRMLRNMRNLRRVVVVFLAAVMFGGPGLRNLAVSTTYAQPINPPRTNSPLKPLVEELLAATSDANDTDSDGLPDSVEAVIGTDPNNADSDFDRLDDYSEESCVCSKQHTLQDWRYGPFGPRYQSRRPAGLL